MTDADRKARERQRKKAAGLVRIEEWVPADRKDDIRKVAESMRKEADEQALVQDVSPSSARPDKGR